MNILADSDTGSLFHQWMSVQFDYAHLLSELGFSIAFEIVQIILITLLWKKVLKPKFIKEVHEEIDAEHGVDHLAEDPVWQTEGGKMYVENLKKTELSEQSVIDRILRHPPG